MAKIDHTYNQLLGEILAKGFTYEDPNRKGVKRIQIPHYTFTHNFQDGFPALTTKQVYFKGAVGELLVFLTGSTDIRDLWDKKINFWDKDWMNYQDINKSVANQRKSYWKRGKMIGSSIFKLGKIYPYQMRKWNGDIDQLKNLIDTLKNNPMATKKTVTMWNPSDLKDSCLSPCHWSFEVLVEPIQKEIEKSHHHWYMFSKRPKYSLTIKWNQHSVDTFLGFPINLMYYSLLCHILADMTNMYPKGVIANLSNVHIYKPHLNAVKEQLKNDPDKYNKCDLSIDYDTKQSLKAYMIQQEYPLTKVLKQFKINDFQIPNYESYPEIKAEMIPYIK